ncbi:MAG: AAA family ATPase [Anaerolineales bacterium]|nr:AAA family ATPase [Anaerolineales bacterium]
MNAIYITSTEPYSGKSALCLALGKNLQEKDLKVGYLKPMSTQAWRTPSGQLTDEDAAFVKSVLGLEDDLADLSPVIITSTTLRRQLKGVGEEDLLEKITNASVRVSEGKDVLIVEGGASLREGYVMGLSNLRLAEALGAPALVVNRYRGEMETVDDALAANFRLGDKCMGVIINHVPVEAGEYIDEYAEPFLKAQGIPVLGTLPSKPRLSALSVGELVILLEAEVLTEQIDPDALVETFTVGAMTVDAALSRFRRQRNKAVITGGDRADIQFAALETSTVALILTGNLHPSPVVINQAENLGVPILLVPENTMETVEIIERAYGKTRLGQPEKLEMFMQLIEENVDLEEIYRVLGID